jgi:hypothetical protein
MHAIVATAVSSGRDPVSNLAVKIELHDRSSAMGTVKLS